MSDKAKDNDIHPLDLLKARLLDDAIGINPLSIKDQLAVIMLEQLAPIINLMYTSSTGTGAEDFATDNIFSEAMKSYLNNDQKFFT